MSPRSFLVSRHNQNLAANSSSASSSLSSPPLSPTTSTTSAWRKDAFESFRLPQSNPPYSAVTAARMAVNARTPTKQTRDSHLPSPPTSPPNEARPTTPTSPVRIPTKSKKNTAYPRPQRDHRHHDERRHRSSSPRSKDVHTPESMPASVAALLAVTTIPHPRRSTRQRSLKAHEKPMTVESILHGQTSEKELSLNFIKGPLDVLLSPPEDLEDDDLSIGESTIASPLSTSRTVSCESVPSLTDSFSTEGMLSPGDTPCSAPRGRRVRPTRKSLTPVSSPPGQHEEHPLYQCDTDLENLDFTVFDASPEDDKKEPRMFGPFRSAFKSNLTASLRALRNAARSFSTMNMPSIPAEDFLTRSILTMEPHVPFTDERMPPTLEEEPSAAVRRYLNPTQTARLESQATSSSTTPHGSFTASIQMQTYKVHRSRSASPSSRASRSYGDQSTRGKEAVFSFPTGPRQREMRENSDFIRVAVMEMAMRKNGKLDEQRPGRARWALPPRKTSAKPYEIGPNGIPARWIPVTS